MERLPKAFPPCGDIDYNTYFSKPSGNFNKNKETNGQSWEAFSAWGQYKFKFNKDGDVVGRRLKMNYKAVSPSIPILQPIVKSSSHEDRTQFPLQQRLHLVHLKDMVRYQKSRVKTPRCRKILREIIKLNALASDLLQQGNGTEMDYDAVNQLADERLKGYHRVPQLFAEPLDLASVPIDMLGGCVKSFTIDGRDYLVHADGESMKKLSISSLSTDIFSDPPVAERLHRIPCLSETLQTEVQQLHQGDNNVLISTRSLDSLNIHKYRTGKAPKSTLIIKQSGIVHTCFSPYIRGELVYSRQNQVYMVDGNGTEANIRDDWHVQPGYSSAIRTVQYASHPRSLVMTDGSRSTLYDIRTGKVGTDLLLSTSSCFHEKECIVTSLQSSYYKHHILGEHSLVTVDERFPGYPVTHQIIPCMSACSLISQHALGTGLKLLLMGSMANAEVFAMIQDSDYIPALSPIWRVSKPNDIMELRETEPNTVHKTIIKERLSAGLIGATAIGCEDSFTVYQLSAHGDLSTQTYKLGDRDTESDVTLSAGCLQSSQFVVSPRYTQRCHSWCEQLLACSNETNSKSSQQSEMADSADLPVRLKPLYCTRDYPILPLSVCPICNPSDPNSPSPQTSTFSLRTRCIMCEKDVGTAAQLSKAALDGTVFDPDDESIPSIRTEPSHLLPSFNFDQMDNDPNTQIYRKLWNNEDLSETLIAREAECERRREHKRLFPHQPYKSQAYKEMLAVEEVNNQDDLSDLLFDFESDDASTQLDQTIPESLPVTHSHPPTQDAQPTSTSYSDFEIVRFDDSMDFTSSSQPRPVAQGKKKFIKGF